MMLIACSEYQRHFGGGFDFFRIFDGLVLL